MLRANLRKCTLSTVSVKTLSLVLVVQMIASSFVGIRAHAVNSTSGGGSNPQSAAPTTPALPNDLEADLRGSPGDTQRAEGIAMLDPLGLFMFKPTSVVTDRRNERQAALSVPAPQNPIRRYEESRPAPEVSAPTVPPEMVAPGELSVGFVVPSGDASGSGWRPLGDRIHYLADRGATRRQLTPPQDAPHARLAIFRGSTPLHVAEGVGFKAAIWFGPYLLAIRDEHRADPARAAHDATVSQVAQTLPEEMRPALNPLDPAGGVVTNPFRTPAIQSAATSRGVQDVVFIDLRKCGALGLDAPVVDVVPVGDVASDDLLNRFDVAGGKLAVLSTGGRRFELPNDVLEVYSRHGFLLADMLSQLGSPTEVAANAGLIAETFEAFARASAASVRDAPHLRQSSEQVAQRVREMLAGGSENPLGHTEMREAMARSTAATNFQRVAQGRFWARLNLLVGTLTGGVAFTDPHEVPVLPRAVVTNLRALYGKVLGAYVRRTSSTNEAALARIRDMNLVRWGMPVAAAALYALAAPESAISYFESVIGLAVHAASYIGYRGRALITHTYEQFYLTGSGFAPTPFYQTYLANGLWRKAAIGWTACLATALVYVAIPIQVTNALLVTTQYFRDRGEVPENESFRARIRRWMDWFIRNENARSVAYYHDQAQAAEDKTRATHRDGWTAEDNAEALRLTQEIDTETTGAFGRLRDRWRSVRQRLSSEPSTIAPTRDGPAPDSLTADPTGVHRVTTFGGALAHFLFSYASLTPAFSGLVHLWNQFTIFRRMVLAGPISFTLFMVYPTLISAALNTNGTSLVVPSATNGVRQNIYEVVRRAMARIRADESLEALEALERAIIRAEQVVFGEIYPRAYEDAVAFASRTGRPVANLVPRRLTVGGASVSNLNLSRANGNDDPGFTVTMRHEIFVGVAYEAVMTQVLGDFLRNLPDAPAVGANSTNLQDLKARAVGHAEAFAQVPEETIREAAREVMAAESFRNQFASQWDSRSGLLGERLRRFSTGGGENSTGGARWDSARNMLGAFFSRRVRSTIDGFLATASSARIRIAIEQMRVPGAMARAVRQTLSALIVKKVAGIVMISFATAQIRTGINRPFYPESMMGPDSYFYMSKYLFLGLATSVFIDALATTWGKLQENSVNEENLGSVPTEAEYRRGYSSWFARHLLFNRDVTFLKTRRNYIDIIWGNMGPAFVLMAVTNFWTLGRFDLDGYLTGYILAFTLGLDVVNMWLEQILQASSFWEFARVPHRLRSHPTVVSWWERRVQRRQFIFSLWEKTLFDFFISAVGNVQRGPSQQFGTEGFSRILFANGTPTEWMRSLFDAVLTRTRQAPTPIAVAAETVVGFCDRLLTNDYTSWGNGHEVDPRNIRVSSSEVAGPRSH